MNTSTRIGFIGLGNMGAPIAKNLIGAGFDVMVLNRTVSKATVLQAAGGKIASTMKALADHADIVVTMLSDDGAVKEVCEKFVPLLKPGSVHVSMSTIAPATIESLGGLHREHSVQCITAPVMGRPQAAEARMLYILVSGEERAKQKLKPVFDVIGQRVFDFGNVAGVANTVKLILNFMIFTNVELLSEVMLFAEKMNVSKKELMETINNTQLGSPALKIYGELLTSEKDIPNGFATILANKDLRLAQETAASAGLNLPLANLIRNHFEEAIALGDGAKDLTIIIQHLRNKLT